MLQDQVIPIDFGQGVDTKTDPKNVVAGKMLRLENAVFTNLKRITKRNGYTALSSTVSSAASLSAPQMVHEYNGELIAADAGRLLSYSPSESAWFNHGPYTSTEVARQSVDQTHPASGFADTAVLGNYVLNAWSTAFGTTQQVLCSIVDATTGASIIGNQVLSTGVAGSVRCVVLANATLGIVYTNSATHIVIRTISFLPLGVIQINAEQTIAIPVVSNGPADVIGTSTGAFVIYRELATGFVIKKLDATGAVIASVSLADANIIDVMSMAVNSVSGDVWVYWTDSTGGNTYLKYAVYTSALALVLGATTIFSDLNDYPPVGALGTTTDATHQLVYYSTMINGSGNVVTDTTFVVSVSSGGVVGIATVFAYGVRPISHEIAVTSAAGTQTYAMFLYRGGNLAVASTTQTIQTQYTIFLLQLGVIPASGVPVVAARIGSGVCQSQYTVGALQNNVLYLSHLSAISATKLVFGVGIETQNFENDSFISVTGNLVGVYTYTFDFASANSYRATNAGGLALLNGGLIQAYDGLRSTEFGFHLYPELTAGPGSVGGGGMAAGTYSYIVIYQWTDAQGNLHQSAPSLPVSATIAGINNSVSLTITNAYLSQKINVCAAIYRTQASGSIYYQVNNPVDLNYVNPDTPTFTFVDIFADAAIAANPQPYTSPASPVLENSTPPPSTIIAAHNNRAFFVNAESSNEIWYTKSYSPGTGLSPSAFLIEQIDPKFGAITALSEMDEKLVIFKANGILIQGGDGANDTGNSSTLSFPQMVPSDVGCSELKSVVITPNGLMFKSVNGIYMISRSTQVQYIGLEVEQYNSQVITSAVLVPGKSQILFLSSSGLTLVYDYIFNQWSTFTSHTGLSATVWQSSYVYATSAGAVFQASSTSYTDNGVAYSLLAQSSWLHLGSVQGFQRVRRLAMLGDYANGPAGSSAHAISVSAAYDFSTSFSSPVSYTFGAASTSGSFQYRERLPRQKCDAISLLIQETTTGSSLESIDLSNISFEAGVKRGVNKLPAGQSVG